MKVYISNFLEPFSYFILLIAVLLQHRCGSSAKLKVLVLYYMLATSLMGYAAWLILNKVNNAQSNNNWVYNSFYFISLLFLSYYMYHTLPGRRLKMLVLTLLIVNGVNFIINDLVFQQQLFNSTVLSVFIISIVLLSFLYFFSLLRNIDERSILAHFDFWLVAGYLLYYLGSFFIVLSWRYLINRIDGNPTPEQRDLFSLLWSVHNVLLLLSALLTLTGHLWIRYRRRLHLS